jgi:hypothetical protein
VQTINRLGTVRLRENMVGHQAPRYGAKVVLNILKAAGDTDSTSMNITAYEEDLPPGDE